ncbi:MAG TPA: molecular chaperone DnaJ [Myxococcales bacterium]|jgi:hypothetical protein
MNCEASREAVSRACRTLLVAEPDGLSPTDIEGWRQQLRRAFQRRAYETHPDRAATLGRPARELEGEFQAVNAAFQLLKARQLVPPRRADPSAHRAPAPAQAQAQAPAPAPAPDHFHQGPCPERRLRLGELLYYKGQVSWRTLMGALAWQRRQRPLFGGLAVEWGFLTPQQVQLLLEQRCRSGSHLPLGEFAFQQGMLTAFQLMALLGRQRQLQRPLGEYFVERGLVSAEDLARLVLEQKSPAPAGRPASSGRRP